MLDVKQEEILRSREIRVSSEEAYDAWKIESPLWGLDQANTLVARLATDVLIEESRKEVERLRMIRDIIRQIKN